MHARMAQRLLLRRRMPSARRFRAWPLLVVVLIVACGAVRDAVPKRPPTPTGAHENVAELWIDPGDVASRDLSAGPGGAELTPDAAATYTFAKEKTHGTSPGYRVRDAAGRRWSVKLGAEAQPEVVVSRLLWAAGYHQPPTYYVARF